MLYKLYFSEIIIEIFYVGLINDIIIIYIMHLPINIRQQDFYATTVYSCRAYNFTIPFIFAT